MAATTSLSCIDYISFKFGCQSISRDMSDIYKPVSQDWVYSYYNNNSRKRASNDVSCFDQGMNWKFPSKTFFAEKKEQRFGIPPRGVIYNNNSEDLCDVKNLLNSVQEDALKSIKDSKDNILGGESCNIKDKTAENAVKISSSQQNNTLMEITNKKTLRATTTADVEESVSDSELELLQICGLQEDDDEVCQRLERNSRLSNRCPSRKRPSADNSRSSDSEGCWKRVRPCVDFYRMHNSRISPNCYLEFNEKSFVPIEES